MAISSLLSTGHTMANELDRIQRDLSWLLDSGVGMPANIRASARGTFPPINVATTPRSIEVLAFAPGLDSSSLDVSVDRGVLTLAGRRAVRAPDEPARATYANERFEGSFKRALSLPDDADGAGITASYRDGVLQVSVPRREQPQPRRIQVI